MLARHFFVLVKTAHIYSRGHPAMAAPVADFLGSVRKIYERREEAALSVRAGYVHCADNLLKPDAAGYEALIFIVRTMGALSVGTVTFSSKVSANELDEFVHLMVDTERLAEGDRFEGLEHFMEKQGVAAIDIEPPPEEPPADEGNRDQRERAKVTYAQTIEVVSEVMADARLGKTLKLRRSKRIVQRLIDTLLTAETNLLGLTTIRSHDEYTYNHSVNVGILSMAVGQRINMKKHTLVDLGMSGIFHDIGKSCIPLEILNKPSSFNDEEWKVMKRHPVLGVKELLRLKGVDALTARIMTGAFEHHMYFNLSGYPKVPYNKKVSLLGSIISIADFYDALVSSRVYKRTPSPPDDVLKFMISRSGTYYDPVLVKIFVNCIGIYPLGSLCYLTTGELAVVMENNPDPEKWNLPKVRIVSDRDGREVEGRMADLDNPREGRGIARTVDAEKYGIDVSRYFL
jgi:HD-GYP domain-containing protein (c-di-GMP phosphodiesterase class II)